MIACVAAVGADPMAMVIGEKSVEGCGCPLPWVLAVLSFWRFVVVPPRI